MQQIKQLKLSKKNIKVVIKARKLFSKGRVSVLRGSNRCQEMIVISNKSLLLSGWKVFVALINIAGAFLNLQWLVLEDVPLKVDAFFSGIFLLDMLVKCITEREIENETTGAFQKVRSIKMITTIYLKGEFMHDLIAVMPFHLIFGHFLKVKERLLLLRVLRLKNVSKVLKTRSAIRLLRDLTKYKARKMTEKQSPEDKIHNYTYIVQLVYAHQVLKIFESFFILVFISFFLGVIWFVFCMI